MSDLCNASTSYATVTVANALKDESILWCCFIFIANIFLFLSSIVSVCNISYWWICVALTISWLLASTLKEATSIVLIEVSPKGLNCDCSSLTEKIVWKLCQQCERSNNSWLMIYDWAFFSITKQKTIACSGREKPQPTFKKITLICILVRLSEK